jgi:predicted CoA-binding protein
LRHRKRGIVKANEILARARQEKHTLLTEIGAKQIWMQAGINCTDARLASTKGEDVVVDARIVLSAA